MQVIKPKVLHRGDVIGLTSPASPPSSMEALSKGIRYLEQLGYRVEVSSNIYKKRGYLAGTDQERVCGFHELFRNRYVKAIFTVRGGYGSIRLLRLLDYALVRRNPKILLGYSDITALQLALFSQTGLVSFSGPMLTTEMAEGLSSEAEERLWQCLTSAKTPPPIVIKKKKYTVYQPGISKGRLIGGNLSVVSSLLGTKYFPDLKNSIWFFEETDERPYRIDRMLQQLKTAGKFDNAAGIIIGDFTDCSPQPSKPSLTLRQVLKDTFECATFPVMGSLQYGHIKNLLTLPIGIRVQINTKRGSLYFLEGGVSE